MTIEAKITILNTSIVYYKLKIIKIYIQVDIKIFFSFKVKKLV